MGRNPSPRVGTRGGVGRMRGPRACPRPVGLPTHEHPEYHRNRTLPQDKHKAPSPPFRRPLSLQQTLRDESHPVRIDTMLCWE